MESPVRRMRLCRSISFLFVSLFVFHILPLTSPFEFIFSSKRLKTSSLRNDRSCVNRQRAPFQAMCSHGSISLSDKTQENCIAPTIRPHRRRRRAKWDRMILDLTAFQKEKGHSVVTAEDVKDDDKWSELYCWTRSVRRNYIHQVVESRPKRTAATNSKNPNRRHYLPREKLLQLQKLDFCWDLQGLLWDRRYNDLKNFYREHGHSRVPANYPNGLGVFVRNCRREYRSLERGEPSTLTVDRLNKLFAVEFVWSKSREEAWETRHQQLLEFFNEHGHSNVPERFTKNPALGLWCMNQRIYYYRLGRGEMSSLTEERIQLLEDVGFVWHYQKHRFDCMLNRLVAYYQEHGHICIPTNDTKHVAIRLWLATQRHYYHRRMRDLEVNENTTVPLTDERIKAIESAIPDFRWRVRGDNGSGPSSKDWAMLFDEMRKKGLQPGMPSKQHWFEGVNPFSIDVKEKWTEEDLLALWNQEGADEDGEEP